MPLAAGTCLGRHKIIAPIGAEAYRARDRRLERDVAVKVLPEHLAENPQALGRFAIRAMRMAFITR